jgi:A/G-specific adenine glycosylase
MLVALDDNHRVLLHRRPPNGIWGGLWSLPQFESLGAADGWMNGTPDCAADPIIHTFTHFRLRATPWRYHVDERSVADRGDLGWFGSSDLQRLGLPQPVRAWTGKLFKEDIQWQEK